MTSQNIYNISREYPTAADMIEYIGETTPHNKTRIAMQAEAFKTSWNFVLKLGFCNVFHASEYDHYVGNVEECMLDKVLNIQGYFQGKVGLCGEIVNVVMRHKVSGEWVFVLMRYFEDDDDNTIDNYGLQHMTNVLSQRCYFYKQARIILLVHNADKVRNIIVNGGLGDHATSLLGHVMDLRDLDTLFYPAFKQGTVDLGMDDACKMFGIQKQPLRLRFHQKVIVRKMTESLMKGEKNLLIGAKPRSGKTYMVGGLFGEFIKFKGNINALIVTPAPTETLTQFSRDMFMTHSNFNNINIVEVTCGADLGNLRLSTSNIIIVSKQLIDGFVGPNTITAISDLDLNFLVFDENHFHGTTKMSQDIFSSYTVPSTAKIYLTATYSKPLYMWNIPEKSRYFWDITDESLCKDRNIDILATRHGNIVRGLLSDPIRANEWLSVYDSMPTLELITTLFNPDRYAEIWKATNDSDDGYSCSALLCGKYDKEVDMMLSFITDNNRQANSIFTRIRNISIMKESRTLLCNRSFTTQLWFLPYGYDMKIKKVSEYMLSRMMLNTVFKRYEIKVINCKMEYNLKDLKKLIHIWEMKAKNDGRDGLILLAGNQLTLRVTLPLVDVVFLFNDIVSSDKILQMMYRSMTETLENEPNPEGIKKCGFVVDMNPHRVLNTVLDMGEPMPPKKKIEYVVYNNLISIDSDMFETLENKSELVERLISVWKEAPANQLRHLVRQISENTILLNEADQKTLNGIFKISRHETRQVKLTKSNENSKGVKPGRQIMTKEETKTSDSVGDTKEQEKEPVVNISLEKDVLPFVLPLACIMTLTDEEGSLNIMLNIIKEATDLALIFDEQCEIWWKRNGVIDIILEIAEKYVLKDSSIHQLGLQLKMSLKSLLDSPKELLEMITYAPNNLRKKTTGKFLQPCLL